MITLRSLMTIISLIIIIGLNKPKAANETIL